jgi:hypothetical protein
MMQFLIIGYRRAQANAQLPDQEIDSWLSTPCIILADGDSVANFWARKTDFPLVGRIARATLTFQDSSSASERAFSEADYLSGGDRSSISPEVLNARLILRKNTAVRAEAEGVSLFGALTRPADKEGMN